MSSELPAGAGTTIFTGRLGQGVCAVAAPASSASVAVVNTSLRFMRSLSVGLDARLSPAARRHWLH
jgi:hypothetical protein